jgi:NADH:ubiquinone oxidoreductase subunit 2 (subunit N)
LYNSQKINNRIYSKPLSSLFLSNLANLFKSDKLWALSFVIIFFSVAGIPPLSGFLAKVFVLLSLVFSGYKIAAVILVLISAISVFYYVRVIKVVFFEPEGVKTQNQRFHTLFNKDFFDLDCMIMGVCLFSLIFFFFYPSLLILTSQNIVLGLFNV